MSRIYLTSFTESRSVIQGFYPFSVELADNGWVFVGGINISQQNSLAIRAYQSGELKWTKSFENSTFWGRISDLHFHVDKDNSPYLYAAGSIGLDFSNEDFEGIRVSLPPEKPKPPNPIPKGYEGHYQEQSRTYPIFIKLSAHTGEVAAATVSPSRVVGFDGWKSITVDESDNVYVAGGGWEPGPDPSDPYNNALFDWRTLSINPSGSQNWQFEGEGPVKIGNDGLAYTPFWQTFMLGIPKDAKGVYSIDSSFESLPADSKLIDTKFEYIQYVRSQKIQDWLWDSDGNLYILTNRQYDNIQDLISGSPTQGVTIIKILPNGELGWFKQLNLEGLGTFGTDGRPVNQKPTGLHYAASMVMTPSGDLLIGGTTNSDLNAQPIIGNGDGFFCEVSTDGHVLNTWIFGTENGYESIQQVKIDSQGNVLVAGFFSANEYSLEGTNHTELVLISEKGFTLRGNDLNNLIQGGDGNDTVYAGLGDDLIVGGDGKGDDKYYGGDGIDTVKYTSATWGITVDLDRGTATSLHNRALRGSRDAANIGTDKLHEIENITAGSFNDVLSGNLLINDIKGGDGDDQIDGKAGDDKLNGEAGNDTLTGGTGNDVLTGGTGDDVYDVDSQEDVIVELLNQGNDTIRTALSNFTLRHNVENLAYTGRGPAKLTGNTLDNMITGGRDADTLDGGGGNDILIGGLGNDRYRIHEVVGGNDTIIDSGGADGLDWIDYGRDYLMDMSRVGVQGRDLAITFRDISSENLLQTTTVKGQFSTLGRLGLSSVETFYGVEYNNGGDLVYGGPVLKFTGGLIGNADNNIIVGYAKTDRIDGRSGSDVIFAGDGNDNVRGGIGDDVISGGYGNDVLFGDAGNDQLRGDAGNDTLTGGTGADEFWFRFALNSTSNVDTITDFQSGQDKICLSTQLFHSLNGQISENNFLINQNGQATDADDRLIFNTNNKTLYYDGDGVGGAASIAFVTLMGTGSLNLGDIWMIG